MAEPTIVNYIEISGKDIEMDALSVEEQREIAEILQDQIMERAGYKRRTA